MSLPYTKPALTVQGQVALLRSRGMTINDPDKAAFYLSQINYYRLGAYWLPFEVDHAAHQFLAGTTFDQVLDLYDFDRGLRLLLLDAIERVEVAVRTRWAYEISHRHGPHGYLDPNLARDKNKWAQNFHSLESELKRSDEIFITHYETKYSNPKLPPVWAVCEVMSLGLLSRWYKNLRPKSTRKEIAGHFGFDQGAFDGMLEHLTYVRNICAHHSRLWNRVLTFPMPISKHKPMGLGEQMNPNDSRLLYNSLVALLHIMDTISPGHHWRRRLIAHLDDHLTVVAADMGFPSLFRTFPIWQEAP